MNKRKIPAKNNKIKPFIEKYSGKGINYPSEMIGKKLEKNNPTIALNALYTKKRNIYLAYVSRI